MDIERPVVCAQLTYVNLPERSVFLDLSSAREVMGKLNEGYQLHLKESGWGRTNVALFTQSIITVINIAVVHIYGTTRKLMNVAQNGGT